MSRYRDDRDGADYRDRDRALETRYETRGDYGRQDPGFADEGRYGSRSERDFRRERFGSSGAGRFGERAEYSAGEPRYGNPVREGNGRSEFEEGREYLRQRFGEPRMPGRSRVRCRDIMTRDVTVATRDSSLEEVARMMREEDTGVIPVVDNQVPAEGVDDARRSKTRFDNGKLVGLITDRDMVVRALAEGKDAQTTRAEEIMTTDVYTAKPNDRVIDVIRKMADKQVRRIPVVGENNNLRGIISMADVALETEEDRELAEALEEISSGSSFWNRVFG